MWERYVKKKKILIAAAIMMFCGNTFAQSKFLLTLGLILPEFITTPFIKQDVVDGRKLSPRSQIIVNAAKEAKSIDYENDYEEILYMRSVQANSENLIFVRKRALKNVSYSDSVINGVDNNKIKIRIYKPKTVKSDTVFYYIHGGGWSIGNLWSEHDFVREVSSMLGVIAVGVDYRLAPEFKYPSGLNDVESAYIWIKENLSENIIVGGESAGANLAAALTHRLINNSNKGQLKGLAVFNLPSDMNFDNDISFSSMGEGYVLTSRQVEMFRNSYLNDDNSFYNPEISPYYSEYLSEFPTTLSVTSGFDPVRDSGNKFAEKLIDYSVNVSHKEYRSTLHSFKNNVKLIPQGKSVLKYIKKWVEKNKLL